MLGFFPVGDAYIQTNPMYGRGCASAFVQAHALGSAIAADADPSRRARSYHREVWRLMRPHYRFSTNADAGFLARAKHAQHGPLTRSERVLSHGFEQLFLPALDQSPLIAREWGKLQQMAEGSPPWMFMAVMLRMFMLWCLRTLRARRWQPPDLGPTRDELLRALAIDRQQFPVRSSALLEQVERFRDPTP